MMTNGKITARLEPVKTCYSKPINTAADLSKLNIENPTKPNILHSQEPDKTWTPNLMKPYIQNQITHRQC